MKFREVFRFEAACQARRPWLWVCFVALIALTFHIATEAYIGNAREDGYFFNAPFVITSVTLLICLLWLPVAAAITGSAAARDISSRMHPLVYTTPVGKAEYLGGRFLAAFFLNALMLLAVPAGLLLALLAPALELALVGPFRPAAYLGAYVFFALPNAFIITALFFSMTTFTRRGMASYIGGALVFFVVMFSWQYVARHLGHWQLGKLMDPLGLTVLSEISASWTAEQKNARLIALDGSLLANRLAWLSVAFAALALTHFRFRFRHHLQGGRRAGKREPDMAAGPISVPRADPRFGSGMRLRQVIAVAGESFRAIVFGWGGLVMAGFFAVLVLTGPELMEYLGVPLFPVTALTVMYFTSSVDMLALVPPLLIVFAAGELAWRERDARMSLIADAAPLPEWALLLGRFAGLALVIVALQALTMAAAMLVQLVLGYTNFETGLYVQVLIGLQLVDYLLFALLAIAVQVIVNQKYAAHLVVIVAWVFTAFAASLGIEHKLLVYASDIGWAYSDMRGFEPFLGPWLLFKLYWTGWALLLAIAARLLWVRGQPRGFTSRLALAWQRLSRPVTGAVLAAVLLSSAAGGLIFYNTNVLNDYRTSVEHKNRRAEYERRYAKYANLPQPLVTAATLDVDIRPTERKADIRGSYTLRNNSDAPVETLHLATAPDVETVIEFDRAARLQLADTKLGHRIFTLEQPLAPGETMEAMFTVRYLPRGFRNDGIQADVVANGTHIEAAEWLPAVGYQPNRELHDAGDRRVHGLPARPEMPSLDDPAARRHRAGAERIDFEAVVSTDPDQVAIAPGTLRETWMKNGRRHFRYSSDAPIRNEYAFFSADYAVHEARWDDVAIEVFHHPGHGWNAARMAESARASLADFSERFGAYPHGQIRLVEHPGQGMSLHAAPINVSYEEGFALFNPADDRRDIDFPFAIIAHEVAHQWWGNQLTPANVEGAALLTESLAWYSALGVVERTFGRNHLQRLLDLMREAYLAPHPRGGAPLLRTSGGLGAYRKGPFVMYALREYIGDDAMDKALRRLIEKHGAAEPPLPTSLDLYRELEAVTPEPLHPLLHDLFETNTYWELATTQAAVKRTPSGWAVSLDVSARKVVVDRDGEETEVPMNDPVEIGVFGNADDEVPLYLGKHRVHSGKQRITVTVPSEPVRAGVDPRGLLMDMATDDNVAEIAVLNL